MILLKSFKGLQSLGFVYFKVGSEFLLMFEMLWRTEVQYTS